METYCFTMHNTQREEKFEVDDQENFEHAVRETLAWLDKSQLAEKDELKGKLKQAVDANKETTTTAPTRRSPFMFGCAGHPGN